MKIQMNIFIIFLAIFSKKISISAKSGEGGKSDFFEEIDKKSN